MTEGKKVNVTEGVEIDGMWHRDTVMELFDKAPDDERRKLIVLDVLLDIRDILAKGLLER